MVSAKAEERDAKSEANQSSKRTRIVERLLEMNV